MERTANPDSVDATPALLLRRSRDLWLATSEGGSFVRVFLPRENHEDVGILDIAGVATLKDALRENPIEPFSVCSASSGRAIERAR